MPSKPPISRFSRRAIKYPSKLSTFAIHRPFHPSKLPSQIQELNKSQSTTLRPPTTTTLFEQAIEIVSPKNMGRSGYDTTNMKVAKAPRPAASKKQQTELANTMENGGKIGLPKQQQQQQKQQDQPQACPIYNLPQPNEQQQHGAMPMPSLEGRGWTFWF